MKKYTVFLSILIVMLLTLPPAPARADVTPLPTGQPSTATLQAPAPATPTESPQSDQPNTGGTITALVAVGVVFAVFFIGRVLRGKKGD